MSIIMDLFQRSQERKKYLTNDDFWDIIDCIDHEYSGDSEAVVSSLIHHLKRCDDEYIFAFDDKLSALMYALDGKTWADEFFGNEEFSEEKFLSARCAAVAAGLEMYTDILGHRTKLDDKHIHENENGCYSCTDGLLTAAAYAWSLKHLDDVKNYPHTPKYSLKSHSNATMWE